MDISKAIKVENNRFTVIESCKRDNPKKDSFVYGYPYTLSEWNLNVLIHKTKSRIHHISLIINQIKNC